MESTAKSNPSGYNTAVSAITQAIQKAGYDVNEWLKPTLELVARESSFNPNAKNPSSSAQGLFQFLDATRKNYGGSNVDWNDPLQQAIAGIKYIKDRYGNPSKALAFWDKNKEAGNAWY